MAADEEARHHEEHPVLRGAAVIGGGALVAWLLWRWRRGGGFGGGGDRKSGRGTAAGGQLADSVAGRAHTEGARPRLFAFLNEYNQIVVDGAPITLAELLVRARAAGALRLFVSGGARTGAWDDLRYALIQAGIDTLVCEPSDVYYHKWGFRAVNWEAQVADDSWPEHPPVRCDPLTSQSSNIS